MRKFLSFFASSPLMTSAALAHNGHGLTGTHWHATDAMGFVAFVAVIATLIWYMRK